MSTNFEGLVLTPLHTRLVSDIFRRIGGFRLYLKPIKSTFIFCNLNSFEIFFIISKHWELFWTRQIFKQKLTL